MINIVTETERGRDRLTDSMPERQLDREGDKPTETEEILRDRKREGDRGMHITHFCTRNTTNFKPQSCQ